MEIDVAIRSHGIPLGVAGGRCMAEAAGLEAEPWKLTSSTGWTCASWPFVTIDGEDARDFDDAVYCEERRDKKKGGWRLWVAIADVSHYVRPQAPHWMRRRRQRGNSVYFPERVVPMLPEALSNGLCSLKPVGGSPGHGLRDGRSAGHRRTHCLYNFMRR